MQNQQRDELPPEIEEQSEEKKATLNTSEDYQTPVDSDIRKTGVAAQTDAKPTAVPESGSSDQLSEGGDNQGTEKR